MNGVWRGGGFKRTAPNRQRLPMVDHIAYHIACISHHVGDFLWEQMKGFHDLLRQKPKINISVHILGMKLNLNGLPNNAI
jgi:hypothetical protein